MAEAAVSFSAADGSELKGIWCTPEGPGPFPAVLCIHGLTLTQSLFAEPALALAQSGVATLRLDLRGHGASGGRLQDQGFEDQLADVRAGFEAMGGLAGADPARRGLLGFSLGGALGAVLAAKDPSYKALALWSPLLKTGPWNEERRSQYGLPKDGFQEIWDKILVSERLFGEAQDHDPYRSAVEYAGPFFVCHGGKDRNHPQARSVEAANARQLAGRSVASYFPPFSGHRYHQDSERRQRDALTSAFFGATL